MWAASRSNCATVWSASWMGEVLVTTTTPSSRSAVSWLGAAPMWWRRPVSGNAVRLVRLRLSSRPRPFAALLSTDPSRSLPAGTCEPDRASSPGSPGRRVAGSPGRRGRDRARVRRYAAIHLRPASTAGGGRSGPSSQLQVSSRNPPQCSPWRVKISRRTADSRRMYALPTVHLRVRTLPGMWSPGLAVARPQSRRIPPWMRRQLCPTG